MKTEAGGGEARAGGTMGSWVVYYERPEKGPVSSGFLKLRPSPNVEPVVII